MEKEPELWSQRNLSSNLAPGMIWHKSFSTGSASTLSPTQLGGGVLSYPSDWRMLWQLVGGATDAKYPARTGESRSTMNCPTQDTGSVHH